MGKYSGYGCGGRARRLYEVENRKELQTLVSSLKTNQESYYILGGGYNTLIAGGKIDRAVIILKKDFSEISVSGDMLKAGSGATLGELLKVAAENNLAGLEFLSGIPGTVGGALVLNAGTSKNYIGDLVREVEILDTEKITIENHGKNSFNFKYRDGGFKTGQILTGCSLGLKRGDKSDIIKRYRENLRDKKANQPLGSKSCGCVFKNPENSSYSAGELIDRAGLKGFTVGDAQVSPKHANFIVNRGKAVPEDIYRLIKYIRKKVEEQFNTKLELELKLLGYEQ